MYTTQQQPTVEAHLHPCTLAAHPPRRLAYSQPGPPTPTALTAASAVVELLVLAAAALLTSSNTRQLNAPAAAASEAAAAAAVEGPDKQGQSTPSAERQAADDSSPGSGLLLLGLPAAVLAGLEIG